MALRVLALATAQDEGSAVYLRGHLSTVHDIREVAIGFWSGLRAVWVFVVVAPMLMMSKGRAAGAALLALAVAATFVANVPLRNDFSRSASTLLPAAVLGIILLMRVRPRLASWLIAAALAFNLVTPAQHVIEASATPAAIHSLRFELNRLRHPPPRMAVFYLLRASKLAEKHQLSRALEEIETAERIDPNAAIIQMTRGTLLTDMRRPVEAAACYDAAVRLAPAGWTSTSFARVFVAPTVSSLRLRRISGWHSTSRRKGRPTSRHRNASLPKFAAFRRIHSRLSCRFAVDRPDSKSRSCHQVLQEGGSS